MKTCKQTKIKATPATAAERQAKRKAKLLSESQDKISILRWIETDMKKFNDSKINADEFIQRMKELLVAYLPMK